MDLDIGLEFVIFIPLVILAEIIFIVCIIFNCIKIKKLDVVVRAKSVISIMVFVLLLPVLAIILPICREMTLLNNSDFILVGTEGEMFGKNTLVYTIGENYCKKVSIGANFRGAWIDKYFINPANAFTLYAITMLMSTLFIYLISWLITFVKCTKYKIKEETEE